MPGIIKHTHIQSLDTKSNKPSNKPGNNAPPKPPSQPGDNPSEFKPESEFVLTYDLSAKPAHMTGTTLRCFLNNFDSVELAGVVRKTKERNSNSQTFYVYLALNQADVDPSTFELWNSPPSEVLFPSDSTNPDAGDDGDNGDGGDGGPGAFRTYSYNTMRYYKLDTTDPSDNPNPPTNGVEALAVFAEQVGDQKDPVQVEANFDISVSGSFNDPKKHGANTRVVTIDGRPFPIDDPSAG